MTNRERRLEEVLREVMKWLDDMGFEGWAAYIRRELGK